MDRASDLRRDYDRLGELLHGGSVSGSEAAQLSHQRRMISLELEHLEAPEEVPFVDQLEPRRKARVARSAAAGGES